MRNPLLIALIFALGAGGHAGAAPVTGATIPPNFSLCSGKPLVAIDSVHHVFYAIGDGARAYLPEQKIVWKCMQDAQKMGNRPAQTSLRYLQYPIKWVTPAPKKTPARS